MAYRETEKMRNRKAEARKRREQNLNAEGPREVGVPSALRPVRIVGLDGRASDDRDHAR